jgi:hypothetical protein
MSLCRYFSTASSSVSYLKSSISRALGKVGKPFPEQLQQAQQFLRFNIYLKQENGEEVPISVFSSSYSPDSDHRYMQVTYSSAATEAMVDERALALELSCGLADTRIACSAVVVGEAEEELTTEDKSSILTQLSTRFSQLHPEVSGFLYSPSLPLRHESLAASSLFTLSSLSSSLASKSIGISHFSSDFIELIKGIDAEKGKVVSLTEPLGAMMNPSGLNITQFLAHFNQHGTIKGFDGGETRRILPWDMRKDILVLNHLSGLKEGAQIVAETAGLIIPPEWEEKALKTGITIIPAPLMDLGEVLCAYLTSLQGQNKPKKDTKLETEAVKQLLKSKAKTEKRLKDLFTAAVTSLSQQTLSQIQAKRATGQTLRDAMVLKALDKH